MTHPFQPQHVPPAPKEESDSDELEVGDELNQYWWSPGAGLCVLGISSFVGAVLDPNHQSDGPEVIVALIWVVVGAILITVMGCNEARKRQMNRIEETLERIESNQEAQRHFHEQQLRAMYGLPPE